MKVALFAVWINLFGIAFCQQSIPDVQWTGSFYSKGDGFTLKVFLEDNNPRLIWDGISRLPRDLNPQNGKPQSIEWRLTEDETSKVKQLLTVLPHAHPGPTMAIGFGLSTRVTFRSGELIEYRYFACPAVRHSARRLEDLAILFVSPDIVNDKFRKKWFTTVTSLSVDLEKYAAALLSLRQSFDKNKVPDWQHIKQLALQSFQQIEEVEPESIAEFHRQLPGFISSLINSDEFPKGRYLVSLSQRGRLGFLCETKNASRKRLLLDPNEELVGTNWAYYPIELQLLVEDFVWDPSQKGDTSENHPLLVLPDSKDLFNKTEKRHLKYIDSGHLYDFLFAKVISKEPEVIHLAINQLEMFDEFSTAIISFTINQSKDRLLKFRKIDGKWRLNAEGDLSDPFTPFRSK